MTRTRRPSPGKFAAALRRAIADRGGSIKAAAAACGVTEANMHHYKAGHTIPSVPTALRMAEVFDAPALHSIVLAARRRPCAACGLMFVDAGHGGPARLYCTDRCSDRSYNRRTRQPERLQQAIVDRNDAEWLRRLIAANCEDCTLGDGICRDSDCKLRPASPLPFVPLSRVRVA